MTKPIGVHRKPFVDRLRALGFARDGHSHDPIIFEKVIGRCRVDVQLWVDGAHRASFGHGDGKHRWRWTTPPTSFDTLEAMDAAIAVEFGRGGINVNGEVLAP